MFKIIKKFTTFRKMSKKSSTLKIAMTVLVNYLQSNVQMDDNKLEKWITKRNQDKDYPIGTIIEDAIKLPVTIDNIYAIMLCYDERAKKSPEWYSTFKDVIEMYKGRKTPLKSVENITPTTSQETVTSTQTPKDNEATSSKESNKVKPVDETTEFKDNYSKFKNVNQQVELLTMHQRSNTLPNALCRNRFPQCPTPTDKEFAVKYNRIIEFCQNELLKATLEFNSKRLKELEEKCKTINATLTSEITDPIKLEINTAIRNKGNGNLHKMNYRVTGNQSQQRFKANKLPQKAMEPKHWEPRHRSGSNTNGRNRSAPYSRDENSKP
jgi:hypothetical protein